MSKKKAKNKGKRQPKPKPPAITADGSPLVPGADFVIPESRQIDELNANFYAGDEATDGGRHLGSFSGVHYDTLRQMARGTDVIGAIIETRINQVASFCVPQEDEGQIGYQIRLRDREATPTKADKAKSREISNFVFNCGDNRAVGFQMDFEHLTRQVIRDSLILDQLNIEILETRGGDLAGFVPVDAGTIRRAMPTDAERAAGRYAVEPEIATVQVLDQRVVAAWSEREMVFAVRRPRSDIRVSRYGYPELEELLKTVTSILHATSFNAQNFTHGIHASGILAIKSKMDQGTFRAFKRYFHAMLAGPSNAKKMPILQLDPENKEEIQSVNLANNNKEMEFKEWLAFLQKIACAVFQIDPAELGFIYGNEGQTGSLSQQGPEARVQFSREKGLRPLLRFYAKILNRWVVHRLDPRFEIVFVGLEEQLKNSKLDESIKKLKSFATVNEIRAKYDMPALESEAANMILDATYMNTAANLAAQAAESEEGAQDEGGGQSGADDEPGQGEPGQVSGEADSKAPSQDAEGEETKGEEKPSPFASFFKSQDERGARMIKVEV